MSILSTAVVKVAPLSATGITATAGGTPAWTTGDWAEIIASAAADLAITGLVAYTGISDLHFEVDIGIGTAGNEVRLHTVRWFEGNPGSGGPGNLQFPIALGGITSGSRVVVRSRAATIGTAVICALQYVESPDSDQVTTARLSSAPSAAASVTLTPNSSAWTNSSWVEITPGLADPSALAGFAVRYGIIGVDYELDIGIGASSSEAVITTLRSTSPTQTTSGNIRSHIMLPAVYQLTGTPRISVRLRKSGTDTTDWFLALLYYGDVIAILEPLQKVTQLALLVGTDDYADDDPPPTVDACTGGGTVATGTNPTDGTSLATATALHAVFRIVVNSVTYDFAQTAINSGTAKGPRVSKFGRLRRALPDDNGGIELPKVWVELSDHDNLLRGWHDTYTLQGLTGKVLVADEVTWRAGGANAQVRFSGVVRNFLPLPPEQEDGAALYRLELEDPLTLAFSDTAQDVLMPPDLIDINDGTSDQGLREAPYPVMYGSLSDEDEDEPKGTVELSFIGTETVPDFESLGNLHKYLICLSPTHNIQSIFRADPLSGDPPTARSKAPASEYGVDIFCPHQAGWLFGVEYSVEASKRITVLYMNQTHPAANLSRYNRIPLTANLCPREETGDATGDTISTAGRILLHLLNTVWARTVADEDWPAMATRDSFSIFDTLSFEEVDTRWAAALSGGLLWAFVLGHSYRQVTLRDVFEQAAVSGDIDCFINRFGQVAATFLDRTDDAAGVPHDTAVLHIQKNSFAITPKSLATETVTRYVYKRNYLKRLQQLDNPEGTRLPREPFDGDWLVMLQTISNSTSITALGGDPRGKIASQVQEMEFLRDTDGADAVAQRRNDLRSLPNGRAEATYVVQLQRADTAELGHLRKVTHPQGIGTSGWVAQRCQLRAIEEDWNDMTASLTVRDVDDLLA